MKFASAVLFCLATVASASPPKLLSLSSLSSVLHSESENEYLDSSTLSSAANFELEKQEAIYRRRLDEGDSSLPSLFPAFVCDHTPGLGGHERREKVSSGLNRPSGLRIVYNREDMACFQVSLEYSDLEGAPEDLTIHPYSHPMKLGPDAISNIMANVTHHAFRGFNLDLCHGRSGGDELAETLRGGLKRLFEAESGVHSELLESFFWSDGENRRKLKKRVGNGRRTQADVWMDALGGSEGSKACLDATSVLGIEHNNDPYGDSVHITGAVKFVDVVASHFENNEEGKSHGLECLLTVIGFMAQRPEVCHVGNRQILRPWNTEASWIVQSSTQGSKPFYNAGITGTGQTVALSDTGLDLDNCYFGNNGAAIPKDGTLQSSQRKVVRFNPMDLCFSDICPLYDDQEEQGGHGTHCAGSIAGSRVDGQDGYADGVAKDAKLAFFDIEDLETGYIITPSTASGLFNPGYEAGARLHSASWGTDTNYYTDEDYNFDSYLYANEDFLLLVAAGNSGDGDTLNTAGSPANAKNIVAVGATESTGKDIEFGQLGYEYLASFSSRGPTADGRIKPDVVAPGHHILSASAEPDMVGECDSPSYPQAPACTWNAPANTTCVDDVVDGVRFLAGTSMATPVTAGAAALIRQYFTDGYYPTGSKVSGNAISPSGSLVKAVLMNSGRGLTGVSAGSGSQSSRSSELFDNHQGFGRVTLADTLSLSGSGLSTFVVNNEALNRNSNVNYEFTISSCSATSDFSVTLVWTDPTGNPNSILTETGQVTIDGATYSFPYCANCLVNDMDLKVTKSPGTVYYPNGGSSKDSKNTAERVVIKNVSPGDIFTVNVRASNIYSSSQKFSLVASGCFSEQSFPDVTPSPTTPMTPAPTREPTTPSPTSTSAPTMAPITGEFCEVWIPYKNLRLLSMGSNHPGETMFDDADVALAFRETVSEIAGAECVDESWICYYTTEAAGTQVNVGSGLRMRNLQTTPDNELEVVEVDFTVSARLEGSTACGDDDEEGALVLQISTRIIISLTDGTFQAKLRSKGVGTFLAQAIVENGELIPTLPGDTVYLPRVSTEKDRKCTNWQTKQWLAEHLWEAASAGGAIIAMCCCCGICFAMYKSQRSKRSNNRYSAKHHVQLRTMAGKSPFHNTKPQPVGSSARMATMGYKGQSTRNASAASRLASGQGSRAGGRTAGKKGKTTGRTVW